MAKVVVSRIRIPKSKLAMIPEHERNMLFMLGHIVNELTILSKLHIYASNYARRPMPTKVEERVNVSQTMLIGKLLTGKIKEAWEFIRGAFLSSPLGRT